MREHEEEELARLIDAGEISPEEVAEIEREDKRYNEIRKEESGEDSEQSVSFVRRQDGPEIQEDD